MTEPDLAETLPPELIHRFPPLDVLGEGTQGVVYRARQDALDRTVVVKVLRLERSLEPTAAARFEREARILAALDHPHVVKVLEFGTLGNTLFMVSPDEGGTSLARVLASRVEAAGKEALQPQLPRMRPAEVVPILAAVLEGLEAVHGIGVVHRDLKPANLLVTADGRIRILDFGLASIESHLRSLTATGTTLGTPLYMSPQQIRGDLPHPSDDLYAVGLVAYQLLSGTHPMAGRGLDEVLRLQQMKTPDDLSEILPGFPVTLSAWVRSMVAKSREGRPGSAGDALRELFLASRGEPGAPSGALPAPEQPSDRGMAPESRDPGSTPTESRAVPLDRTTPNPGSGRHPAVRPTRPPHAPPADPTAPPARSSLRPGSIPLTAAASLMLTLLVLGLAIHREPGGRDPGSGREVHDPIPPERFDAPDPERTAREIQAELLSWLESKRGEDPAAVEYLDDPGRLEAGPFRIPALQRLLRRMENGAPGNRFDETLARVDRIFSEAGLKAPFSWAQDTSRRPDAIEVIPDADLARYLGSGPGEPVRLGPGWAARALEERRTAVAALEQSAAAMHAALDPRTGPRLSPGARSILFTAVQMTPEDETLTVVRNVFQPLIRLGEGDRAAVAVWTEAAHLAVGRLQLAAARSLAEEPEHQEFVLTLLRSTFEGMDLRASHIGVMAALPPGLRLARFPATPAGRLGRAWLAMSEAGIRHDLGIPWETVLDTLLEEGVAILSDPGAGARVFDSLAASAMGRAVVQDLRFSRLLRWIDRILVACRERTRTQREAVVVNFLLLASIIPATDLDHRERSLREQGTELFDRIAEDLPALSERLRGSWPDRGILIAEAETLAPTRRYSAGRTPPDDAGTPER